MERLGRRISWVDNITDEAEMIKNFGIDYAAHSIHTKKNYKI